VFRKDKDASSTATAVDEAAVLDNLRKIIDPDLHRDIVSLGMIKDLTINPGDGGARVSFTFELTTPACPVRDQFKKQAEAATLDIPGVAMVDVKMSANVRASGPASGAGQIQLPGVKNVIAVGSGKGGVGKSTSAAAFALIASQQGKRVLVIDTDPQSALSRQLGLETRSVDVNLVDTPGHADFIAEGRARPADPRRRRPRHLWRRGRPADRHAS